MITPASYTTARSGRDGNRSTSIVRQFILIVLLYVFLYNPIFLVLGIGSIKPLLIIAVMYAFVDKRVFKLLIQFKYEALFTFIIITYVLFTTLRGDVEFVFAYMHLIWFLESLFLPVVLVIWFRSEFERYGWERWVVITGFIAALITLLLILNLEWNDYVRSSLIDYSLHGADEYRFVRGFGIADGLQSSYGVIQGIILGISLWLVRRSALYAVPIIPLLISIAFNARVGFVAVLVSLVLLIAHRRLSVRLTVIVFGVVLLFGYVMQSEFEFIQNNYMAIKWVLESFSQTVDFISGNSSGGGALDTLLVDGVFFPPSALGLLLGDGVFTFLGKSSDNGYINQIMFGGIVYVLLLVGFLAYMYMRVSRQKVERFYPAFFVLILLAVNIKWNYLFVPNGMFRMFGLYYVWVLTNRPDLKLQICFSPSKP